MSVANPGKKFEVDFKKSIKDDVFVHRLKTRQTEYRGDNEIADYLLFRLPNLFVFELKTTKEKRLPFDMIRPNQIIGIRTALLTRGVLGGFVVQFREPYSHWFVPVRVIDEYIECGKKSIPIKDFIDRSDIIEIPFTQKRVSCTLDVNHLLDTLQKENYANNITSSS